MKPCAWGHNWATLFPGDNNMQTWPSRLGESRIWDSKIWSRVPWDSDPRMTALVGTGSSCKWQTRPLIREGMPHQQTCNCLAIIKVWSWAPDGCLTPRQTGRLAVGGNIILNLTCVSQLRVAVVKSEKLVAEAPLDRFINVASAYTLQSTNLGTDVATYAGLTAGTTASDTL
jgi:hypothetical protein